MRTAPRRSGALILAGCACLLLTGCFETVNYRHIQDDFNSAVAADNVQTAEALGALTGSDAQQRYTDIQAKLTDKYIGGLDERLKPNAYALRAVAQWRCGKLEEAYASAKTGSDLPNVANSPRDQIVLTIVPALVIDQQLVTKFKKDGQTVTEANYNNTYSKDFAEAVKILKGATTKVQPGTPESIIFYVHMQRWRVLHNWSFVIDKIDGGAESGTDARNRARAIAKSLLGGQELKAEIRSEEEQVPADHPIRKAMEAIALQ